jgi:hypothetical protein
MTCITSVFSETITDEQMGYSVFLPDGWNTTAISSTQHRFEDTTGVYQSMIVINRYDFSAETVFEVAEDWTRANFIAYVFSIEADPFCALVYYDSVTARQNETLWATDVFSQFFSIDTAVGDWAEYIRFTASGSYGYELYAIGPEADMLANVGMYVAIIDAIVLPETSALTVNRHLPRSVASVNGYQTKSMTVNALGRMVAGNQVRASVNLLITGPVGTRRAVKAVQWR